jgi:hypothetical protein
MSMRFRLTLEAPNDGQDNFFLWSMVVLPVIAEGAYIFDAHFYDPDQYIVHRYQGLLSTILVVFTYLRYCAPIESRKILAMYYIILCMLNEIGTIGYIIAYVQQKDTFNIVIYIGWGILELIMTSLLIYYRVYKRCRPSFHVESKHLFHFISRLEVILAIFIPFYSNNLSVTLTKHSIGFFLLFDFFSDSYSRFHGIWIKSTLYLFVCSVTVCVATEWIFSREYMHNYEIISSAFELISGCLCDTLIILQFIPYHLTPTSISNIAREGLVFQQTVGTDLKSIEVVSEPEVEKQISQNTIIELSF